MHITPDVQISPDRKKLAGLSVGTTCLIRSIESEELMVGLMELGITLGERIVISDLAPMGGPMAIRFNGTKIAIRKEDAARILVEETK